jgi:hypothetical protein
MPELEINKPVSFDSGNTNLTIKKTTSEFDKRCKGMKLELITVCYLYQILPN